MGVEKNSEESSNRLKKSNSVDVYIPPALRRSLDNTTIKQETELDATNQLMTDATINQSNDRSNVISNAQSTTTSTVTRVRRERRPDRAVYVPRARRSLTTPPQVTSEEEQTTSSNISQLSKPNNQRPTSNNNQKRKDEGETNGTDKEINSPDRNSTAVILNCDIAKENDHNTTLLTNSSSVLSTTSNSIPDKTCDIVDKGVESIDSTNKESIHILKHSATMTESKPQDTALRIEDVADGNKSSKGDHDIAELQKASKEINRSNRRIMKQTFNSDILEIPEKVITEEIENKKLENKKESKRKEVDPENDDWDSMFDDNGECLDPKILEELNSSVGKVKIETPKADYSAYYLKQSILNDEEFPHVLEISNFPMEFKTQDLLMIFSTYKESGFDIKWVDDTHALAVFSSSKIAAEVLSKGHPFVLLKPLADATVESRMKAKKCSSSLQPYRPRPETCAALARRLVTGALGVRLKTAAEERENEKRVLKEAKERKLLAAKQRDEAWES